MHLEHKLWEVQFKGLQRNCLVCRRMEVALTTPVAHQLLQHLTAFHPGRLCVAAMSSLTSSSPSQVKSLEALLPVDMFTKTRLAYSHPRGITVSKGHGGPVGEVLLYHQTRPVCFQAVLACQRGP